MTNLIGLEKKRKTSLYVLQWMGICILVGFFSGTASALLLASLEWANQLRLQHPAILCFLPLGGLLIGLLYHYFGADVVKGNNLLLEEYESPKKTIPFKMAPFVLFGTFVTHLFGGSAGREGTAVQMGSAIADQFTALFKLTPADRKTLILIGISAGFASVFGTPLGGALFALEVLFFSKLSLKSILLSFVVAFIAHYTVALWAVKHTHYSIPYIPTFTLTSFFWVSLVGILFGLAALVFSRNAHFWGNLFSKTIPYPPLRPFVGGILLACVFYFTNSTIYMGLGVPTILNSFSSPSASYVFLLKILFTGFTLGAGFKGGEVTPLFFVGATLGSMLSVFVPLPLALLAGMGFVAVFSGATHTPIACTVMGIELFGISSGLFLGLACFVAYFSSGTVGIYQSQIVRGPKFLMYKKLKIIKS